jgi:hypothetical protein
MPVISALLNDDSLAVAAAITGRIYGEGLRWALALPLPELARWHGLIPRVMEAGRVR